MMTAGGVTIGLPAMGTMVTGVVAGCDAVIVCDPVTDIFNPNVVRASTGVLFSVPVVVEESTRVLAWLKEKGVRLIVLDTQVAALASIGRYMKPANHFKKISQDGNLNLTAETSRAFLASIQIRGWIIYTPGHSEDSVTLVLDDGLAFTGDALSPMQEAGSKRQVESIRTELRQQGVRMIYPGHGPAPSATSPTSRRKRLRRER